MLTKIVKKWPNGQKKWPNGQKWPEKWPVKIFYFGIKKGQKRSFWAIFSLFWPIFDKN